MKINLESSIGVLKGVGDALLEKLQALHLYTVSDLVFHLPFRYEDKTKITPIEQLVVGVRYLVEGTILSVQFKGGPKKILNLIIEDESGILEVRFFYAYAALQNQLKHGVRIRCYGEIGEGKKALLMQHPELEVYPKFSPLDTSLTPVYSTTDGLSQKILQKIIKQIFDAGDVLKSLDGDMPVKGLASMPLSKALLDVHFPKKTLGFLGYPRSHPSMERIIVEELAAHFLALSEIKKDTSLRALKLNANKEKGLKSQLLDNLPFSLTNAQKRVALEIEADLEKDTPMMRLVQGDVGSGKTIVAALGAMGALEEGYQVALMAPTDLLANQHALKFKEWFTPLGIKTALLSGKITGKKRKQLLEELQNNEIKVLIGTHALFQEGVNFAKLALVIIDEQHRFGVQQRLSLWAKGKGEVVPHQLIMTATPIPRTLAQTFYADLDISTIDELPPGRLPIKTVVIPQARRDEIIKRVGMNCKEGKQIYWVCPLIEQSETLSAQAAEIVYEDLKTKLPQASIGLVHGRLKNEEKQSVMDNFKEHKIDILVATTVIEVGVDVPNAQLMIIENAERMGLSQLHQLRGRVGRGSAESFCVLLYQEPLSYTAKVRLETMKKTQDGFVIAQKDLKLRGAGDLLGTKQTGLIDFKVASFEKDGNLFEKAKSISDTIIQYHPQWVDILIQRWRKAAKDYISV